MELFHLVRLLSFNTLSYEDNLNLCGQPLEKLCNRLSQKLSIKIHEYYFLDHEFYEIHSKLLDCI